MITLRKTTSGNCIITGGDDAGKSTRNVGSTVECYAGLYFTILPIPYHIKTKPIWSFFKQSTSF